MELTNSQRKIYASLDTTKGRRQHGLFMAQGDKCVADTIGHFTLRDLVCTASWATDSPGYVSAEPTIAKRADMERISTLTTAPEVIAIYEIPPVTMPEIEGKLCLALDAVQDPGNLGTIIRVADWMGVDTIIASPDTVDVWNPKVIQATMGAISRVKVHYAPLADFLGQCKATEIYGTFLDGENIYHKHLSSSGIIVMGNEGRGISPDVAACISQRLYIPSYPPERPTSESLNVAIATAITLSEFRRR